MGPVDRGWILLGRGFRCHGVPADLQTDLAALLQGFPAADPAAEALELRLETAEGPEALLAGPGGGIWKLRPEEAPLSSQIEYRLVSEAISRAAGRWILHAGAVEGPRGTCLVVGESGAGKTSLTLWLWSGGLRLVTDDLCPIGHGTLAAERFPRALHMDCEYSPRLLERIPPRPPSYPADYYPFPDASGGAPPPVSDLLVLERGPRPAGEIVPLSQAEAAHLLLGAVIKSPAFDYGQALMDMIRLSAQCRAHRLRAATPEGAGAAALALLTAG
ncbi:MAG TPA: hypothetical protein VGH73_26475 [Thermoanaerobaculia bacterium]|jgi:hypothetical protein